MAKKSTAKTGKKKTTAKKKAGAAKSPATKAKPKKKAVKKAAKKTAPKKTAAAKKGAKKAAPKKKKMTAKALMKKTFDRWQPESLYVPPKTEVSFSAPPFVTDDEMRAVLTRKFDFDFAAIAKPPKPKRTLKELMNLKFDSWKPESYYEAPGDAKEYVAPPFVTDASMREVLNRKFDIDFEAIAKPPKPKRTIEELMNLRFDRWQPAALYAPPKDEAYEKGFVAPPFVADEAMREVLNRKFDFDFAEEFAKAEAIRKAEEERLAAERKAEEERLAAEEAARMEKIKEEAAIELEKMKAEAEAQEKAKVNQLEEDDAPTIEPPAPVVADPMEKTVKYVVAGLVILFTIITAASYTNSSKFYLVPKGEKLQVWKGHFSPMGKALVATLHGVPAPEVVKPLYTKTEAYTLAFDYFLNQGDDMLKTASPDLDDVESALEKAAAFAFTDDYEQAVRSRMTRVHLMNFLFKSDASALKGSLDGLEKARTFLEEAALLQLTETQALLVDQKIKALDGMIKSAAAQKAAAVKTEEKAETEEKIEAEKPAVEAVEEAPAH